MAYYANQPKERPHIVARITGTAPRKKNLAYLFKGEKILNSIALLLYLKSRFIWPHMKISVAFFWPHQRLFSGAMPAR